LPPRDLLTEQCRPLRNDPVCERCSLHEKSATVCCPSEGPQKAELFLVGEALGATEEQEGRPFVGDAGLKLAYLLRRAKLKRSDLRIGNTVRCRPPGNKKPTKRHTDACAPFLLHDILTGRPKVIVALGATATSALMGSARSVEKWRGFPERRTFRYESASGRIAEHTCWVVGTFHPAACLHDWRWDDLVVRDLQIAKHYAAGREVLKQPATTISVARTFDHAVSMLRKLMKRGGPVVVDTETTGLDRHTSEILCAGFCTRAGHADILPLLGQGCARVWTPREFSTIVELLADLLETTPIVGQNVKFDCGHFRKLTGVVDYLIEFDTMLAHHCIDENKPHGLTFLAQWYLKWAKYDAAMSQYLTPGHGYRDAPDEVLWRYLGRDCDATFQVRRMLDPLLDDQGVRRVFQIELDLINPICDMEYRGIQTDPDRIRQLSLKARKRVDIFTRRLVRTAERTLGAQYAEVVGQSGVFNPNSHPQLRALLLASNAKLGKKTKGGNISTDKFVLGALSLQNNKAGRVAKTVQEIRLNGKRISTFLDGQDGDGGVARWIGSYDRIHPNTNIHGSRTGRLSMDDPPLQTIPREGSLRSVFVPDTRDDVLLACDYAKLELCIMAWLANDKVMHRELTEGIDLHSRMAITVRLGRDPTDEEFAAMLDSVGKNERAVAKGVNFGIPYGRTAPAIVDANPDAFALDMPKAERRAIVDAMVAAYFDKYWASRDYLEGQTLLASDKGLLRTRLFNRARRLAGIRWMNSRWGQDTSHHDKEIAHLMNEARNFGIQSLASDTLSEATKRCWDGMKTVRLPGFRIVLTVHDALVFNIRREFAEEASALIKGWMEVVLRKTKRHRLETPLKVDILTQEYWGEEYDDEDERAHLIETRGRGSRVLTIPEQWAWQDATERWARRVRRIQREGLQTV
jgi:uracil-DNA glycosylase family 4